MQDFIPLNVLSSNQVGTHERTGYTAIRWQQLNQIKYEDYIFLVPSPHSEYWNLQEKKIDTKFNYDGSWRNSWPLFNQL